MDRKVENITNNVQSCVNYLAFKVLKTILKEKMNSKKYLSMSDRPFQKTEHGIDILREKPIEVLTSNS